MHSYSCRLSFDPAVRLFPPFHALENRSCSSSHARGIMQLLNTPVFLVVLILLPGVILGTGVMALEPLKSPGLTRARFARPAVRDPKAKGALGLGVILSHGAAGAGGGRSSGHKPPFMLLFELRGSAVLKKKNSANKLSKLFPVPLIMHEHS